MFSEEDYLIKYLCIFSIKNAKNSHLFDFFNSESYEIVFRNCGSYSIIIRFLLKFLNNFISFVKPSLSLL